MLVYFNKPALVTSDTAYIGNVTVTYQKKNVTNKNKNACKPAIIKHSDKGHSLSLVAVTCRAIKKVLCHLSFRRFL